MANCLYYKGNPIGIVQSNADDVLYGGGLSVKDKIDEIVTSINNKTNLGNFRYYEDPTTTYTTWIEAINGAWTSLPEDGAYIVKYAHAGVYLGLMYKYGNGRYGMALSIKYFNGELYLMNVRDRSTGDVLYNLIESTWQLLQTVDIATPSTTQTVVNIPANASELYIEYGTINGNIQIYGGGTIVLAKGNTSHPCFVPSYNGGSTTAADKLFYFYWDRNDWTKLNVALYSGSTNGRIRVFWK